MRQFQNTARDAASRSGALRPQARAGRWLRIVPLAVAGGILAFAPAGAADDLPIVDDIPMPHVRMPSVDVDVRIGEEARPYPRGPYAAMPPARYVRELPERPAVSHHEIAAMLRANDYSLLGQVNRRGWVYTVAVLDRNGDDGRAVIDARTGAIIRFVPALDVDPRFDDELTVIYGPPGPPLSPPSSPPPVASVNYENRRGALLDMQRSPRPAVNVPRVVSRAPSAVPLPRPQPVAKPAAPAAQSASVQPKASAVVLDTAKPAAAKPAEAQPTLELKPTQDMPPVQLLD